MMCESVVLFWSIYLLKLMCSNSGFTNSGRQEQKHIYTLQIYPKPNLINHLNTCLTLEG